MKAWLSNNASDMYTGLKIECANMLYTYRKQASAYTTRMPIIMIQGDTSQLVDSYLLKSRRHCMIIALKIIVLLFFYFSITKYLFSNMC